MDIIQTLHQYFDEGGDPDTLRDAVTMVINERADDEDVVDAEVID